MKNSNDTIRNQTHDLSVGSAVPQPTAPPRAPIPLKLPDADKTLAWTGRKQTRKHVRDTHNFNKIETRAVIKFLILQGKAPKEIHAILT